MKKACLRQQGFTPIKSGFTLIELIVVMAIIGVLSTLIINNLNDARFRARDTKRKKELSSLKTSLRLYYNDFQTYPADSGNEDIKGCGENGDEACGGPGQAFATDSTTYMKVLPEFSYYNQEDNGDGFSVKVTLENLSDPDLDTSQAGCPGSHEETDYVICED